MKISPTVGRIVLYFPSDLDLEGHGSMTKISAQPFAATVAYVWSDYCVNLSVVDHKGRQFSRDSVAINFDEGAVPSPHAEWMPYQIGQAKKHEGGSESLANGRAS